MKYTVKEMELIHSRCKTPTEQDAFFFVFSSERDIMECLDRTNFLLRLSAKIHIEMGKLFKRKPWKPSDE